MKIMAVDLGKARTGIAICDESEMLASPVTVIHEHNEERLLEKISQIISEQHPKLLVVGLPRNMDGSEGIQAKRTRDFSQLLLQKENSNIEIIYWDERLTSKMAKQSLSHMKIAKAKEKMLIDIAAAVHILQSYLDSIK